mmetsp:Transcript_105764/g.309395  ORF Transcript_105764/g.309395 Transcript_105764/m.309395 type:complete len:84 (+) Transcript_105764:1741-1992(+)
MMLFPLPLDKPSEVPGLHALLLKLPERRRLRLALRRPRPSLDSAELEEELARRTAREGAREAAREEWRPTFAAHGPSAAPDVS